MGGVQGTQGTCFWDMGGLGRRGDFRGQAGEERGVSRRQEGGRGGSFRTRWGEGDVLGHGGGWVVSGMEEGESRVGGGRFWDMEIGFWNQEASEISQ